MGRAGSASRQPSVKVTGLTKSFGARLTLKSLDFQVETGESLAILGPNGAGKTTLLKILASIMEPTRGKIYIDGLDLKRDAEHTRRRIGIVTHNTFLYGNLTAWENLDFYARLYEVPDTKQRIEEMAAMVGMTQRLHHRIATFSRGMQQRISIARALLHKPSIMLLDEAETGLDQQATAMLWEAMKGEGSEKRTVIMTTHNLERSLKATDRFIILDKGNIVHQGSTRDLDLQALERTYHTSTGSEP